MPRSNASATRFSKKRKGNCKRTSWAANNILSTSRKILQKTVVNLDPFVESLKKNNSDLARKNVELQKEIDDKADEILQLQKESFQTRSELLRLQNFKDSVISSGILEKLMLISSDAYRLHEVIANASRRIDVSSSSFDLSVEGSPKESPVQSPLKITSNVRKPSHTRLSYQNYRPTARSVEMEIDNSLSSPKFSNLSVTRRTVLLDSDNVEDTVMSTPRKTCKLSSERLSAPVSQVDENDTAVTSPNKSSEFSVDKNNEDQDVDVDETSTTLPFRESSKGSSGGQAVCVSPTDGNDFNVAKSCRRSLSPSDDDDLSSSNHDPDYAPPLKPKRKKAVVTRKTSKASGTHPLKISFTSKDKDKDSDINLDSSKPMSKNVTQSTKTSSNSEPTLTASPIPSNLKRKKMEYNEPDVIVEEKKLTFENQLAEVYGEDELEMEQDKVEQVRVEDEGASEAVEKKEEAKEDEVKNDVEGIITSTKRKVRKRKRCLRLVAEDSVFIPISDMTMQVARGNNKENETDDTTSAHNTDEDATSPKSELENQPVEAAKKENDVKENSEVTLCGGQERCFKMCISKRSPDSFFQYTKLDVFLGPKIWNAVKSRAKVSALRSKKEQAKAPEHKKSRTEVDSEKPAPRTKALSTEAADKDSEVEVIPPPSPHRPRRQARASISYVVKLNT
ncbi:unnamed protein product [Rodentolepis nana]|uniref:Shugoshin_C domain-containing protein n=1 Tax=Rodentolepis nana TaxID=102285 RepID=A0A0R3T653_RODNA|nr:unnamed protein product [Rodentolepis nana]